MRKMSFIIIKTIKHSRRMIQIEMDGGITGTTKGQKLRTQRYNFSMVFIRSRARGSSCRGQN